jgi:hypothetical protein
MQTEGLLKQSQQLAGELQTQQRELQQTNISSSKKRSSSPNATSTWSAEPETEQARRVGGAGTELALTSKYKSEFSPTCRTSFEHR